MIYFGNGYTYDVLYKMPVVLRNYHHDLIIKKKKAERDEEEKILGKSKKVNEIHGPGGVSRSVRGKK